MSRFETKAHWWHESCMGRGKLLPSRAHYCILAIYHGCSKPVQWTSGPSQGASSNKKKKNNHKNRHKDKTKGEKTITSTVASSVTATAAQEVSAGGQFFSETPEQEVVMKERGGGAPTTHTYSNLYWSCKSVHNQSRTHLIIRAFNPNAFNAAEL